MKRTIHLLKALADPTRFKILKLFQEGTFCVCELTAALELAQPTISRHLRILEHAGLVSSCRRGQRVEYSLVGEEAPAEVKELLALIRCWHEDSLEVGALRVRLSRIAAKERSTPDRTGEVWAPRAYKP